MITGNFENREMLEIWVLDLWFNLNRDVKVIASICGIEKYTVYWIIRKHKRDKDE